MNNKTVSKATREIIEKADLEKRGYTFTVKELIDAIYDEFRDNWTDEENYEFRLGCIIRQVLNQEDFFSLEKGTYYSLQGNDEDKKKKIMNNLLEKIKAGVKSLNKKKHEVEG